MYYYYYYHHHIWWRNRATSQKVAGSIPDDVTGIFYLQKPSGGLGIDSASNINEHQE
jgi:hypothetical protein